MAKLLLPTDDDHNEILNTAKELSDAVAESYTTLKNTVCGSMEAISQVWDAMNPRERRNLLTQVWPDIAVHRRPDFTAAWSRNTTSKKVFLCPFINLEDLIKDDYLLDFLRSRALALPSTFARQDYEAVKLGITTKQTTQFGLVGHPGLLMFMEVDSYEILEDVAIQRNLMDKADPLAMYGKIVPRSTLRESLVEFVEHEEARCRIENSYWTTQPGLICMRAQKETYSFLCGCCGILSIRANSISIPRLPTSPTMPARRRTTQDEQQEEDPWCSLLSRAPYQAPQRPNFALLIDFVDSKRAYAEDHILELRRSPLYFAEALALYVSNDSRALPKSSKPAQATTPRAKGQPRSKAKGRAHVRSYSKEAVGDDWNKLIQDVQYDAYYDYVLWKALQDLLTKVQKHFDQVQHCIDNNKEFQAKRTFVSDNYQLASIIKTAWQECVRKIKPERKNDFEDCRMFDYMNSDNNKAQLNAKQKVDYLLYQLCPDEVDDGKGGKVKDWHEALDTCLGLHTVADFLDAELRRLADTDPTSRFGAYHARVLSNLVMIAEIDRQLRTYDEHFLGGMIKDHFLELKDNNADSPEEKHFKLQMRDELNEKAGKLNTVQQTILEAQQKTLIHDQEAVRYFRSFGRAKYPEGQEGTDANLSLMVVGESQLDKVWHTFTNHVGNHMTEKKSLKYCLDRCLGLDLGEIPRTKPPALQQYYPVLRAISTNIPKRAPKLAEAQLPIWEHKSSRDTIPKNEVVSCQSPKEKLKTRGQAKTDIVAVPVKKARITEARELEQKVIALKDPHYTTIRALWTNEQLKDVSWKDFLRAMSAVGFGLQKLGGSAWLFTPSPDFNFKHSIYMHEPHPSKSMYPEQASWRGRVLTRRYGWNKHTFTLAS